MSGVSVIHQRPCTGSLDPSKSIGPDGVAGFSARIAQYTLLLDFSTVSHFEKTQRGLKPAIVGLKLTRLGFNTHWVIPGSGYAPGRSVRRRHERSAMPRPRCTNRASRKANSRHP